jgi:endo-1,4-beta-mannosidase
MENKAPIEAIFAYDLSNEVHFNVDKPPFSLSSGKVTTANRKSYDMALAEDKQRMMDENLIYWIDQQRASIQEVDPTALVTVSFPAINSGQTTVDPQPAILESSADFVDLHTYAGWGLSLEQYMRRFGVDGPPAKPTILGEFGASRRAFPGIEIAARVLQEWQAESCRYGFDGWLMWTWEVEEQADLWHGMSENGEIAQALAPLNRPDPCSKEP